MALCGGWTQEGRPADDNVREVWANAIAKNSNPFDGRSVELIDYQTQVVAGTNYKIRVRVDGDAFFVTIFVPLPHTGSPPVFGAVTKISE